MTTGRRFKCAQKGCPNTYNETIGGDGWGGTKGGGDCVPCHLASFIPEGLTPEDIERNDQFMAMVLPFLEKSGWTWQHVKDSYARGATLR